MDNEIRTFKWDLDIKLTTVEEFRSEMEQFIRSEEMSLILNMQEVSYINSAALGVIADAVLQARRQGKELVIAGVKGTLEEIFRIVKFSSFVKLFVDVKAAEAYLSQAVDSAE